MGHGEAIDVINCRFEAERERKVDALRNTRIIMAEIRNLLAKKPKLPHEWLKLPGDENLKPEEEPEPAPPEARSGLIGGQSVVRCPWWQTG